MSGTSGARRALIDAPPEKNGRAMKQPDLIDAAASGKRGKKSAAITLAMKSGGEF